MAATTTGRRSWQHSSDRTRRTGCNRNNVTPTSQTLTMITIAITMIMYKWKMKIPPCGPPLGLPKFNQQVLLSSPPPSARLETVNRCKNPMTLMTRPSRSRPGCVHHAVIDGSPIVTSSSATNQITHQSGPLSRAGGVAMGRVRANMAALIVATNRIGHNNKRNGQWSSDFLRRSFQYF